MPKQALFRFLSIGVVVATFTWLTKPQAMAVVIAIGLSHYALSFVYSRRQFSELIKRPASYLPMVLLIPATAAMILLDGPTIPFLVLYFGLHNALTETYFMNIPLGKRDAPGMRGLARWRLSWNTLAFLVIMWHRLGLVPKSSVLFAVVAAAAILAGYETIRRIWLLRDRLSRQALFDQLAFEGLLGGLLAASFFMPPVSFSQFVLYHFAMWLFIPLPGLARGGVRPVINYFGATAILFVAVLAMTPLMFPPISIPIPQLADQLYLWGYIHISASFALSSLNPHWITRFFLDAPQRAPG